MDPKQKRMRELITQLNKAARAYYVESRELISNFEYDALYDELCVLEKETGLVFSDSPTVKVGYEVQTELPKEAHESPMLSLDKTKSVEALGDFLGEREGVLSWKMDGLTVVLTYEKGELQKAVTRGNGEIGEVITNNAKVFRNIPLHIPCMEKVVLRGEALIRYDDFQRINEEIPEAEAKYKNPRNLCSGSVRQLNNKITKERAVYFIAFTLVTGKECSTIIEQYQWMKEQGFDVVEYRPVTGKTISTEVEWFSSHIQGNAFPSDGLVLFFNDIAYGESLGRTAKFPRNAIAFKWRDEIRETILREVEWSASRTGLINPIGVFDPVELEGTTVSRASLHNVSIMEELQLGVGDTIRVYKANMIIPQIQENLTKSGTMIPPKVCPVCGMATTLHKENGVTTLFCENPECLAKKIKSFSLFVSRDAMNLEGISEATMEKFINKGWVKEPADLFRLHRYRQEIVALEGFGEKSYENLMEAVEKGRTTTEARLLYSLGIPNVGAGMAKLLVRGLEGSLEKVMDAKAETLVSIPGIGEVIADSVVDFFQKENNRRIVEDLLEEVHFLPKESLEGGNVLEGKTFVITGSLAFYENRNALKEEIESLGGKVTGSVTGNTDYLINNDATSSSSKNQKAKALGITIITEEQYREMLP